MFARHVVVAAAVSMLLLWTAIVVSGDFRRTQPVLGSEGARHRHTDHLLDRVRNDHAYLDGGCWLP
jgi:hypothetical protein